MTVDAAEPLNDPDGVPVDVVVDDRVAVLEVLALAHAVRGDEKVDFAVSGEVFGTFLRAGGECRDDADKVLAQVGQCRLVVAGAGDKGRVQAEFLLCPPGKLPVKVLGGVGEGGEDEELAVAGIEWRWRHFCSMTSRRALSLASRAALTCFAAESRVASRLRSSMRSCRQRMRSTSWSSTFTLRPTSRLSKAGSSASTSAMSISSRASAWASIRASVASTSASCRCDGERERGDRAFHPLEDVHAQQVDEALLAVHLPEEALPAANLRAVLGVIGGLLVRQHVSERRVGRECQAANLVVDLPDRTELAGEVHFA
jgi:hypothetical protein